MISLSSVFISDFADAVGNKSDKERLIKAANFTFKSQVLSLLKNKFHTVVVILRWQNSFSMYYNKP